MVRGAGAVILGLVSLACSGEADLVARSDPGAPLDPKHPPSVLELTGALDVRDPGILVKDGRYYLFQSGPGLPLKTSTDRLNWKASGAVFDQNPSWVAEKIPDASELWSPDPGFFGGKYHLYYAASVFGANRSCIGHAVSDALSLDSNWEDRGPLICSNVETTDHWNAIDPNLLLGQDGTPWLVFGSYLDGIKLIRLDASGTRADQELHALAARPDNDGALQAPALIFRGGYYYLFTSFDLKASHRTMVGRSEQLLGPYLDRDGKKLMEGGGTELLGSSDQVFGPGSNDVLFDRGETFNVYDVYEQQNQDATILRIAELVWDDRGWPVSGGP